MRRNSVYSSPSGCRNLHVLCSQKPVLIQCLQSPARASAPLAAGPLELLAASGIFAIFAILQVVCAASAAGGSAGCTVSPAGRKRGGVKTPSVSLDHFLRIAMEKQSSAEASLGSGRARTVTSSPTRTSCRMQRSSSSPTRSAWTTSEKRKPSSASSSSLSSGCCPSRTGAQLSVLRTCRSKMIKRRLMGRRRTIWPATRTKGGSSSPLSAMSAPEAPAALLWTGCSAWFSLSTPPEAAERWQALGGSLASQNEADFLFSDSADEPDTHRIFAWPQYRSEMLTVFRSAFIFDFATTDSPETMHFVLGRYILPSPSAPPTKRDSHASKLTQQPWLGNTGEWTLDNHNINDFRHVSEILTENDVLEEFVPKKDDWTVVLKQ
eukprot:m.46418 g.46418  ORF g.46418 m.46418 type:complete len:379 (+) comp6301_c0_seq3:648-1784(+)